MNLSDREVFLLVERKVMSQEQEKQLNNNTGLSRRRFLKGAGLLAGGLIFSGSVADNLLIQLPKTERQDRIDDELSRKYPDVVLKDIYDGLSYDGSSISHKDFVVEENLSPGYKVQVLKSFKSERKRMRDAQNANDDVSRTVADIFGPALGISIIQKTLKKFSERR